MTPAQAVRAICRELAMPSRRNEPRYTRFLIAVGHAVAGGALAEIAGSWGLTAAAARGLIPLVYWLTKERADLAKGGTVKDGLIDAAFVALVPALAVWPVPVWEHSTILAAALLAAIL